MEFFDKIWGFLASGGFIPVLICAILVVIVCFSSAKYKQVKELAQKFNTGATDDETVALCQKVKNRNRQPKSAEMHDLCCCMLSAMHMERGEEALFFENMNAIKALTGKITWRVNLLLAAYLTEQRYLDMSIAYKEEKKEDQTVQEWLFEQDMSYEAERLETLKANITKPKILDILNYLTED